MGGELFTCPYPVKVQACPRRDYRPAIRSKVSRQKDKLCHNMSIYTTAKKNVFHRAFLILCVFFYMYICISLSKIIPHYCIFYIVHGYNMVVAPVETGGAPPPPPPPHISNKDWKITLSPPPPASFFYGMLRPCIMLINFMPNDLTQQTKKMLN